MNSLKRKPEIIVIPLEWASEIGRNVRRSMRNNSEIMDRWKRRQDHQRIQRERQRIEQEVVSSGVVGNQRKI